MTTAIRAGGLGGGIGSILYTDQSTHPDGGQWEGFIYNAVGHTTVVTDSSGGATQLNVYEAFGQTVYQNSSSRNNRLRNTKERDASIGLDNDGFRYYDPDLGRYIQRDPIGYGDGLNVYHHVSNNPVNRVDPLGLTGEESNFAARVADMQNRVLQARSCMVCHSAIGQDYDRQVASLSSAAGDVKDWLNQTGPGRAIQYAEDKAYAVRTRSETYMMNNWKPGVAIAGSTILTALMAAGSEAGDPTTYIPGGKGAKGLIKGADATLDAVREADNVGDAVKSGKRAANAADGFVRRADVTVEGQGQLQHTAMTIRKAGEHPIVQNQRTVAVGRDTAGDRVVSASPPGLDLGQRRIADSLGIREIGGNGHAEQNLMDAYPTLFGTDLEAIGTSKRWPCGTTENNCAGRMQERNIELDNR